MIRKTEYFDWIENYLSGQLTSEQKKEFESELEVNAELKDQLYFHKEVNEAILENEIIELRESLNSISIMNDEPETKPLKGSFDLIEELDKFNEFNQEIDPKELLDYYESLPKIHIYQHEIASKENIHHFYKEQNVAKVDLDIDEFIEDEDLLNEIEDAVLEKEIFQLRDNLKQISKTIPEHNFSTEQIDQYLEGTLPKAELIEFEKELNVNKKLMNDIQLHKDLNNALIENEVMDLRSTIGKILHTQTSYNQSFESIEKFINNELTGENLKSFKEEYYSNPDLRTDVKMHKEVEEAIGEKDVIGLRDNLKDANEDSRTNAGRSIFQMSTDFKTNLFKHSVAASFLILVALTAILNLKKADPNELYDSYYTAYPTYGISRSADTELTQFQQGMLLFNEQNYEEALQIFRQITENEVNPVAHFYAGESYQNMEKYSSAINEYQRVVEDKENLFVEQAEWYIGLCLIKQGNVELAQTQLTAIIDKNSYYKNQAQSLLKKLKNSE